MHSLTISGTTIRELAQDVYINLKYKVTLELIINESVEPFQPM
jgi:hypothetical protein